MERVFVTGGTGFVGGGVLRALADGTHEVRALARTRTSGQTVEAAGAQPVIGDLFDAAALAAGMDGCDAVFHVAGVNEMCSRDPSAMFRVNVAGSVSVVEAAARAGVRRIVYTSSAAVIGPAAGTVGTEDTPHRGHFLSNYERSKYEAEQAVFAAGDRLGIEVVAVNPSSVQGPGRATGSARLLVHGLGRRYPIVLDTAVGVVDIDDCSLGHLLAYRHGTPGRRYILNGAVVELADAVRLLGEIAGTRSHPIVVPPGLVRAAGGPVVWALERWGDSGFLCRETLATLTAGARYDGSRAELELGLRYTPLAETLRRTVGWLVEYGFVRRRLPNFPRSESGT